MRERTKVSDIEIAAYGRTFPCVASYEYIKDVNNRKLRPNSPCTHVKATYQTLPVKDDAGRPSGVFTHANMYAEIMVSDAKATMDAHYSACYRKITRLINEQLGSFSTLNFLYELRELPELFKKIRQRPQDLRYIDYAFGVAPMLSDLRNALTAYNNQVSQINEKLKRYRSIEFTFRKQDTLTIYGQKEFMPGQRHTLSSSSTIITIGKGTINMDIPLFAQVNPALFALLDDLQIDVSAGNAYNAYPWTWFIDWFLPVGDFLESLPSLMRPQCGFTGTISHKVLSNSDVYTYAYSNSVLEANKPAGSLSMTYYNRYAFNGPVGNIIRWRVDNLSNPAQFTILRDIMFSNRNKTLDKVLGNVARRARARTGWVFLKKK